MDDDYFYRFLIRKWAALVTDMSPRRKMLGLEVYFVPEV